MFIYEYNFKSAVGLFVLIELTGQLYSKVAFSIQQWFVVSKSAIYEYSFSVSSIRRKLASRAIYSITSMARTLMVRLPRLFRTHS